MQNSIVVALLACGLLLACDQHGHPSKTANQVNGLFAQPGKVNTSPDGHNLGKADKANKKLGEPAKVNTSPEAGSH